jgi:uncharacterized protein YoxC
MNETVLLYIFSVIIGLLLTIAGYVFKSVVGEIKELRQDTKAHTVQIAHMETATVDLSRKVNENRRDIKEHDARLDRHERKIDKIITVHNGSDCTIMKISED